MNGVPISKEEGKTPTAAEEHSKSTNKTTYKASAVTRIKSLQHRMKLQTVRYMFRSDQQSLGNKKLQTSQIPAKNAQPFFCFSICKSWDFLFYQQANICTNAIVCTAIVHTFMLHNETTIVCFAEGRVLVCD